MNNEEKGYKGVDISWRCGGEFGWEEGLSTNMRRKYGCEAVDLQLFLSFHGLRRHVETMS